MSDQIAAWIDEAFERGMFQHRLEIEPFAQWLVEIVKPKRILEIGSWKGGSTLLFGRIVGADGFVVSIDLPLGRFGGADFGITEEAARVRDREISERLDGVIYNGCGRLWSIFASSHDAGALAGAVNSFRNPVDLVFIDGDHTLEGVRQDWEWYRWLVRPGGWVAFHDIRDTPWQRETGCRVDILWEEIAAKYRPLKMWTLPSAEWGGIGAVQRPEAGW